VALVSAIFMTGLLVGSCIASYFANRFRQPLRVYAFSQALLSGAGLAFILFRPQLYALLEIISTANPHTRPLAECVRMTVVGGFLLVPTSLIGAGFPLIVQALARLDSSEKNEAQGDAVLVYFANAFGAFCGALICGFYLLPSFGIALSVQLVSLVSVFSAIAAYIAGEILKVDMLGTGPVHATASNLEADKVPSMSDLDAGIVVIWSGFVTMLLEMLWIRLGMLIFGSSSYAFSLILGCQLLGLSAGAFLVAFRSGDDGSFKLPFVSQSGGAAPFVKLAIVLAGVWILFSAYLFSGLPNMYLQIAFGLQGGAVAGPILSFLGSRLFIGALLILPPCTALGMLFPLAVKSTPANNPRIPWLYVLNTFGAIHGFIIGGILLLPFLARLTTTPLMVAFMMVAVFLLLFAVAFKPSNFARFEKVLAAVTVLLAVMLVVVPARWPKAVMASGPAFLMGLADPAVNDRTFAFKAVAPEQEKNLLFYQEGVNAITTVMQNFTDNLRLLRTDGKIEAALPAETSRPFVGSDEPTHVLLGELPLLLCPHQVSDVLLIGLGSGVTADAILDHKSVSKLTVAELEDSVRAGGVCFSSNRHNDGDARMSIVNCDGRNYLSLLRQDYNAIVSQPGEPFLPGMADLYTLEFWKLAKRRLREGGVFCQWVQLYAVNKDNLTKICRTFHSVFPNTLIFRSQHAGEILMVGFNVSPPIGPAFEGKRLFSYIQRNTPDTQSIKGFFPFSTGLWIDYNEFCRRFQQPKVRTRLTYLGFEEPLELITTLRMGPADLTRLVETKEDDPRSQFNLDDSTTVEWALPLELSQRGPVLQKAIIDLFSQVPSDLDQFFFNIGTTKKDTADFIAECAIRYAARAGQERSKSEKVVDYDRCTQLSNDAHRFTYSAATLAAKALVMTYFGRRVPPSFRGLYGTSVASLTDKEDCRMVGLFYAALGNSQIALPAFQKGVELAPQSAQSLQDLGSYLRSLGRIKEASEVFERMMKVDPYSARAKEGAGIALVALGEADRGASLIKQALSMNPNLFRARLVLGRELLAEGHEKEGLYQLYWASRISPEYPEANLAVAAYFVFARNWQAAEENITILKTELPGDSRVNYLERIITAKQATDRSDPKLKALLDPVPTFGKDVPGTNRHQMPSK
jgi:spermidine synthase